MLRRVCAVACLLLATCACLCQAKAADNVDCGSLLQEFNDFFNRQQLQTAYSPQDLLFVLRTPETQSETLDNCLIRPAVPGTQRCPSFTEQIDSSTAAKLKGCNVLSSSDDLSILGRLEGKVAVAAQLRDPVERLVSAYEVAVEVAAQKLMAAGAKNPFEAMQKQHPFEKVYPWSKLIPFLSKDIQKRAEEMDDDIDIMSEGNWVEIFTKDGSFFMHTITDEQKEELTEEERQHLLPAVNPYDNEMVMPLKDFVKHPRVLQLLHNGEMLQILGLTNTSSWDKAQFMRACIRRDAKVADALFDAAVKRLDSFVFVGLADDVLASAELAAATLERPLAGPVYVPGELFIPGVKKVKVLSFTGGMKPEQADSPAKEIEAAATYEATTVEELNETIAAKEADAQKLYDTAYDLFVKGTGSKAEIAAARAQVSAAKAEVMQLKADLEQMVLQATLGNTVEGTTLGAQYHNCSGRMQAALERHTFKALSALAMPDGRQVKFTPEARKAIPEDTLAEIRRLNALDVKLYEHTKQLVASRRKALEAAGKLHKLPAPLATAGAEATDAPARTEEL